MDNTKGMTSFAVVAREVFTTMGAEWSDGYLRNNESHLRNALLPFMVMPIQKVTTEVVDKWWAANAARPVNRRNAYFVLTVIMKNAVRWKYIRSSPCLIKKPGKDYSKPRPRFTYLQLAGVIDRMPENMRAACWVAFSAHLRLGEIVGLNRGDFDPESGKLTISRQVSPVGGTHLKNTKTNNVRVITPMEPGLTVLREYVAGRAQLPSAPLFVGVRGDRLARGVLSSAWVAAREEQGLPDLHFHDTKRVSLTAFAKTGASIKQIMARGGHLSSAAALAYQDAAMEEDAELAARASALLPRLDFTGTVGATA
ncbi:hypothetical protein BH09ACT5_BH09ACT5_01300 [soil metagenome]